jgi:hypothetical protein
MELTRTDDYQNFEPKGATVLHLLGWSNIDLLALSLLEAGNE